MEELFWDTQKAINKTGIKRTTLLKMTYRGEIPSVKVGGKRLWPAAQIQEWVDALVNESDTKGRRS